MKIKAFAKVNIFLKITGSRGDYHTICSRFLRVDELYDTITFLKKRGSENLYKNFTLECNVNLLGDNTISLAFELLARRFDIVKKFFKNHKVILDKKIPHSAGLGGGSSDAAAFLNLCNEVCELNLNSYELTKIGEQIGADVPFFIYNYKVANVEGVGEIVTPFEESPPKLKLFTPNIQCDTATVYKTFRKEFFHIANKDAGAKWLETNSKTLLKEQEPKSLNDLFFAALKVYPKLKTFIKPDYFFSGSGSTFFKLVV